MEPQPLGNLPRRKPRSRQPIREITDEPVEDTGLDRRTRICIWIILIGLANFLAYTILYACFWGEAVNGQVRIIAGQRRYFLQSGKEVAHWVFIYSGIHSISIWPTVGAIMLAMLTLAKDRIIASAYSTARRGRAMITLLAVVIAVIACILTFLFARDFVHCLRHPVEVSGGAAGSPRRTVCRVSRGGWRASGVGCRVSGVGWARRPLPGQPAERDVP